MGGEIPGDTLICCVYVHRAHVRASVGSGNEDETIAQVWTNKNRIVSAFSKLGKVIPLK